MKREVEGYSMPDNRDVHVDDLKLVGPRYLQRWLQHVQKLAKVLVVDILGP
jgi:hypothetical protein